MTWETLLMIWGVVNLCALPIWVAAPKITLWANFVAASPVAAYQVLRLGYA